MAGPASLARRGPAPAVESPRPAPCISEVSFRRPALSRLIAEAEVGRPEEVCGFLLGQRSGPRVRVMETRSSPNAAASDRTRGFRIDPHQTRAAARTASDAGRELLGFYHSHLDAPALPSAADDLHAWPGYAYLIVSVVTGGPVDCRAFGVDPGLDRLRERLLLVTA